MVGLVQLRVVQLVMSWIQGLLGSDLTNADRERENPIVATQVMTASRVAGVTFPEQMYRQ